MLALRKYFNCDVLFTSCYIESNFQIFFIFDRCAFLTVWIHAKALIIIARIVQTSSVHIKANQLERQQRLQANMCILFFLLKNNENENQEIFFKK